MDEFIQLKDQVYVLATSSLADPRTRVLKQGDMFAVFDVYGNIQQYASAQGIFDGATRFLSLLDLRVGSVRPHLLSSTVRRDNTLLTVDLMNRGTEEASHATLPGVLHIFRSKFLWEKCCFERIRLSNYGKDAVEITATLRFKADFADIFEIRGTKRERRGEYLPPEIGRDRVKLSYRGLDSKVRSSRLVFSPAPETLTEGEARFPVRLEPNGQATLYLSVDCESSSSDSVPDYSRTFARVSRENRADCERDCHVETSSDQLNNWIERSQADLHMMVTKTPSGPYPYAGVPYFNTIFGRDGIITAIQMMWINSEIARGVLKYLAATQATERQPESDAEPGKILHEVRSGEMVETGEVPFKRYYGSADSTPLFVTLAGMYYEITGDAVLLRELRPNVEAALRWMDTDGDEDRDGFVEYLRKSSNGLQNQGWKDSHDSVFHADGSPAEGAIALCEIQGYVYQAKRYAAMLMSSVWGEPGRATQLEEEAERLRRQFEDAFWSDELGMYVPALDGKKRPCVVRTSNSAHALFSGIADGRKASKVASHLFGERLFSGWGVRTLGSGEPRFNPMSYHNGSIWPHDNSMIAEGLARYGLKTGVKRIFHGLFDAVMFMDLHRLPELFCGFPRRLGEGPTLYPVACAPQGWAAGSVFLLLKSLLGLSVDGPSGRIRFSHPDLPDFVHWVKIRDLRVGKALVDLYFQRHESDVGINVIRRTAPIEVVVVK